MCKREPGNRIYLERGVRHDDEARHGIDIASGHVTGLHTTAYSDARLKRGRRDLFRKQAKFLRENGASAPRCKPSNARRTEEPEAPGHRPSVPPVRFVLFALVLFAGSLHFLEAFSPGPLKRYVGKRQDQRLRFRQLANNLQRSASIPVAWGGALYGHIVAVVQVVSA